MAGPVAQSFFDFLAGMGGADPVALERNKRRRIADEALARMIGEAAPTGGTVLREPGPGGAVTPTPFEAQNIGTTLGASVNVPGENLSQVPLENVPEYQTSVARGLAEGSPLASRLATEAPLTGPGPASAASLKGDMARLISRELFGTDDLTKLTSAQGGQVRQGISEAGRQEKTPTPPRPTDIRKQIRQIENDIRKARTGDQNSIAALVAAYSGVPQEQASEADTELFIQKLEDEKTLLNNLLPEKFRIKPRKVAPARTPKPRTPGPGASPAGDGEVDKFINKYVR